MAITLDREMKKENESQSTSDEKLAKSKEGIEIPFKRNLEDINDLGMGNLVMLG